MRTLLLASICLLSCAGLAVAENSTGLGAVKLLPKSDAKRIARIEAREGTPAPDRWHVLVHDPKAENGLHEYVIAGGEVVASRAISQFAESLSAEDVIGADAVRIDSDRAAKFAQQYALANNVTVASMNYELKREGAAAAPLWKVTCLDGEGKELGQVVVTASRGNVISHDGFAVAPAPVSKEKIKTEAAPVVAATVQGEADGSEVEIGPQPRRSGDDDRRDGVFHRVGGSLQKFFTGRNTISR